MKPDTRVLNKHYGVLVLLGAFVVLFLVQGSRSLIGVAFKPIVQDFQWARGSLSLVLLVHMAVFAVMLPVVGRTYDRYGAKWVIILSSLCLVLGYLGITVTRSFSHFLVLYGIFAAIGFGGCSITLFGAVASKWFHRRRGIAVSLAFCGGPIGQFVMVPPATQAINTYGWRWVFVALALLALVINLAIALTVMRRPAPQQSRDIKQEGAPRIRKNTTGTGMNLRQAMATPSFWFFTVVMAICGGGDYLVITHLVPMATDTGIDSQSAGRMLSLFGLTGMIGLLLTGPATDRFGNKWPMAITFALRFVIFILILNSRTTPAFYLFALTFGFTMLITAPITTTLPAKLYGLSHIGLISGIITTVHHMSGGLWAYLGGVVFDRTGGYDLIFSVYAGATLIAVVCSVLIREKGRETSQT